MAFDVDKYLKNDTLPIPELLRYVYNSGIERDNNLINHIETTLLSLVVPILVFILASNLLYKMNSKTNMRNAIGIKSSEKGEYLASKFGIKVKLAFYAWSITLFLSSALNISLQFAPQLQQMVNSTNILRTLSGLLITLQYALAYEYISSSETLAQICTAEASTNDNTKIWNSMELSEA